MTFRQLAPPVAVMLLVLVAGTIIHGQLTDRFGAMRTQTLIDHAARLSEVPRAIGAWEGVDTEVDSKQVVRAHLAGHLSRTYRHRETGETVSLFLVSGTSRHISVHTPASCYPAAGFEKEGQAQTREVDAGLPQPVEFAASRFYKEEGAHMQHLEVLWSFSSNGQWLGPHWARSSVAGNTPIYKLYLISPVGNPHQYDGANSPAIKFAREALPVIQQKLFSNVPPHSVR